MPIGRSGAVIRGVKLGPGLWNRRRSSRPSRPVHQLSSCHGSVWILSTPSPPATTTPHRSPPTNAQLPESPPPVTWSMPPQSVGCTRRCMYSTYAEADPTRRAKLGIFSPPPSGSQMGEEVRPGTGPRAVSTTHGRVSIYSIAGCSLTRDLGNMVSTIRRDPPFWDSTGVAVRGAFEEGNSVCC